MGRFRNEEHDKDPGYLGISSHKEQGTSPSKSLYQPSTDDRPRKHCAQSTGYRFTEYKVLLTLYWFREEDPS